MDYTRKDLGKNKLQFQVNVEQATLKQCHEAAVKQLGKDAKVAGFRKGHVPLTVLEKAIDPAHLSSAEIDQAINQSVIKLIDQENLQLLDQPNVTVTKYVPSDTLEFSVDVTIVLPVKLADATKLKIKKPQAKVDDSQIDEVVKRLQIGAASKTVVERNARTGDEVTIDFTGLKEGAEFPGGKAKDYQLELGSGAFIPGFEDGIVGHSAGDKFDVDVTFPKEYVVKDLAGKKAVFKVELKKVTKLDLPKLDDKFAGTIAADFKTMDDLRQDIKGELERREADSLRELYQNQLLDKLSKTSQAEVPDILVNDQVPTMKQQFVDNLRYRGLDLAGYLDQSGKAEQQWEEEDLRPAAQKKVRESLVLSRFIKDQKITVTETDVNEYQQKIISRYNNAQMKDNFQTDQAKAQIRQQLLTERALARLAELNEAK